MCQEWHAQPSPLCRPRVLLSTLPSSPCLCAAVGQKVPISTARVQSNIPKGGTDSTWLYPSPQMFLNALARKHKADDVTEHDAESMVAIHNNMNERTWNALLKWEERHRSTCADPRLLRFRGRPDELSPKARLLSMFGLCVRVLALAAALSLASPCLSVCFSV